MCCKAQISNIWTNFANSFFMTDWFIIFRLIDFKIKTIKITTAYNSSVDLISRDGDHRISSKCHYNGRETSIFSCIGSTLCMSVPTKLSIGNTYNKIRFIKSINYELFYFRINITSMCFNKLHLLIYHCLVFKVALWSIYLLMC